MVFDGALDRAIFDEYIKHILAPALNPGDIVILDNLSSHKSLVSQEAVDTRHAEFKFLPAYSPDLNPIEKMWSKSETSFARHESKSG